MLDEIFDDNSIENVAEKEFKQKLEIRQVIARGIPTGRAAKATVFIAKNNNLYVYITAEAPMVLDDVRKMIGRMGMVADKYIPPRADEGYFDAVALERFKGVFPGRSAVSKEDLIFYRQLAPYNPALVKIKEVKTGEIKQFESDGAIWRTAAKFSFRKVKPI